MQVIDEVAKVPRSMRRQVPMIHEMQKDQKPEEVQISFKEYVDHANDGQNDTISLFHLFEPDLPIDSLVVAENRWDFELLIDLMKSRIRIFLFTMFDLHVCLSFV